jgi:hypothetical protein
LLFKFSPRFDFELTKAEVEKYEVSTEEMIAFLEFSPIVRSIRNGLAFMGLGLFGALTGNFANGLFFFFMIVYFGPLLIDKFLYNRLGVETPTSAMALCPNKILNQLHNSLK